MVGFVILLNFRVIFRERVGGCVEAWFLVFVVGFRVLEFEVFFLILVFFIGVFC